jgi:hypothetical protein
MSTQEEAKLIIMEGEDVVINLDELINSSIILPISPLPSKPPNCPPRLPIKNPRKRIIQDFSPPNTSQQFLMEKGYTECSNCLCSLEATPQELPKKCEQCKWMEEYQLNCAGCHLREGHKYNCPFFSWKDELISWDERDKHCDTFHVKLINKNCFCGFKGIQVPKDWMPQAEKRKREETSFHADAVRLISRSEQFMEKSEKLFSTMAQDLEQFKAFLEEEKANLTDEEEDTNDL